MTIELPIDADGVKGFLAENEAEALYHAAVECGSLGPIRLDTGVALLWISAERESPSWEVMSEHVHAELRRRFVERVLPGDAVQLWR